MVEIGVECIPRLSIKLIPATFKKLKVVVIIPPTPDNQASPVIILACSHEHHLHLVCEIAEISGSGITCTFTMQRVNHVICTVYEQAGHPGCAAIKHLPLVSTAVTVQLVMQRQRPGIGRVRI